MTRYTPQWLQAGSYAASQDRRLVGALWPGPASSGCAVTAAGGSMSVNVAAGQVAVPSQNNTGSTLCSSDAVEVVTLTAAPGTNNRIDLVTCHPRGNDLDGGSNNDFIFDFVTGTVAATPTVPAVPAGQVALAQVYVGQGVAAIVAGNITDVRPGGLAVAGPAASLHARVQRNAAWSTGNNVNQVVPFDTVSRDPYGLWVPAQNAFVAPVAGVYRISAVISVSVAAAAYNQAQIWVNGVEVQAVNQWNASTAAAAVAAVAIDTAYLNVGGTLQVYARTAAAYSGVPGFSTNAACDYLGTG